MIYIEDTLVQQTMTDYFQANSVREFVYIYNNENLRLEKVLGQAGAGA